MKKRRNFGTIEKLSSGRYRARYTSPLDKIRYSAPVTFTERRSAEAWLKEERISLELKSITMSMGPWESTRDSLVRGLKNLTELFEPLFQSIHPESHLDDDSDIGISSRNTLLEPVDHCNSDRKHHSIDLIENGHPIIVDLRDCSLISAVEAASSTDFSRLGDTSDSGSGCGVLPPAVLSDGEAVEGVSK